MKVTHPSLHYRSTADRLGFLNVSEATSESDTPYVSSADESRQTASRTFSVKEKFECLLTNVNEGRR